MLGSGRVVTRNRRFIKLAPEPICDDGMLMQPACTVPGYMQSSSRPLGPPETGTMQSPVTATPSPGTGIDFASSPMNQRQHDHTQQPFTRTPAMLRRLYPHNKPGFRECEALLPRNSSTAT